ncbi:hypothetical protein CBL_08289 [Carabus blaptoides fortunei]
MELLGKERDIFAESVDQFYRKTSRQRNNLAAQIQQMVLQKVETLEAMAIFEERIVKDSVDPLTRQIPLEKFVRHIEDWLRCAEAIIAKLRLRCSALHYKCISLKQQLKQKEELGDTLLPVDLDQMRIEYQVLMEKLEQKNNDLLDMKKKSGDAGFALTQHKKQLVHQMKELHATQRKIAKEKKQLTVLTNSIADVKNEVTVSEQKLQNIMYLVENFTAPDLLDYIMKQKEIRELQKILKVWSRRTGIQTTALKGHVQHMKRLSGVNKTDENWFILPVKVDTTNTIEAKEDQELAEQE